MRRWIARLRRLDRRRIDIVIAALFVVVGEIELLLQWSGPDMPQTMVVPGSPTRRWPGAAAGRSSSAA